MIIWLREGGAEVVGAKPFPGPGGGEQGSDVHRVIAWLGLDGAERLRILAGPLASFHPEPSAAAFSSCGSMKAARAAMGISVVRHPARISSAIRPTGEDRTSGPGRRRRSHISRRRRSRRSTWDMHRPTSTTGSTARHCIVDGEAMHGLDQVHDVTSNVSVLRGGHSRADRGRAGHPGHLGGSAITTGVDSAIAKAGTTRAPARCWSR